MYTYIYTADKLPQIGECPVVMISAEKKVNSKPHKQVRIIRLYMSSYYNICVHLLLCTCPHTTIHVSAYCCKCAHTRYFSREEGKK